MSALDEGPSRPGRPLFENDLDVLADVGVRLPLEQLQMLSAHVDGGPGWAISLFPVIDPSDRYRLQVPLTAWDVDEGRPRLVLYPKVVWVDWSIVSNDTMFQQTLAREYNWRRYPSLPGRARTVSPWDEPHFEQNESFRIWDLWPIDPADIEPIEEAVANWHESDRYVDYSDWVEIGRGDWDLCDYAMHCGAGPVEKHKHLDLSGYGGYLYSECQTGSERFEELEDRVCIYLPTRERGDGDLPWVRYFPGPTLPSPLSENWAALLASSEVNSTKAIGVYPPWERDDLLSSERNYSPWLWLY